MDDGWVKLCRALGKKPGTRSVEDYRFLLEYGYHRGGGLSAEQLVERDRLARAVVADRPTFVTPGDRR